MAVKKGGLGRGFDSLFSENTIEAKPSTELRLSQIVPNREQPRKNFDDVALRELSESIKEHGVIQPLLVRPLDDGSYQIVAGERRWRASRLAGLEKVPVVIKQLEDAEVQEIALIENLQREDLNPIEEALGYKILMETYGLTQEQVAVKVSKSRSAVANALRLLGLSKEEQDALVAGEITPGHARALLAINDEERISKHQKPGITVKKPNIKNKIYVETESALASQIGRKVKISGNGKRGTLTIEFFSDEDLFDLASKLSGE